MTETLAEYHARMEYEQGPRYVVPGRVPPPELPGYATSVDPSGRVHWGWGLPKDPILTPLARYYTSVAASDACVAWDTVQTAIEICRARLGRMGLPPIELYDQLWWPPAGLTTRMGRDVTRAVWALFLDTFDRAPGTPREKWVAAGTPPLLAHHCGVTDRPLSAKDVVMETQWETEGGEWSERPPHLHHPADPLPPRKGGFSRKPVIEPATGQMWPDAQALSDAVDYAIMPIHYHLWTGNGTIRGRVFRYV